ncbi:MAG: type II CRISPR-associated endonuclease Cas1 [bacterium]
MDKRIIDLSEEPARLSVRGELLVISRCQDKFLRHTDENEDHNVGADPRVCPTHPDEDDDLNANAAPRSRPVKRQKHRVAFAENRQSDPPIETTVPFADIAVLVVSHPAVTFTQAVLARLANAGAAFIACDDRHMPAAMMLPLETHFTQTERFAQQACAPLPMKKRLWQQIVQAKVRTQAQVLKEIHGNDWGLTAMAERVRSGDPDNIEAQASRRYWQAIFNDPAFLRDRDGAPPNALLNYGYAVLRAIVARAICAAGLHPSLGLHHHNRYDSFCLASDLMEPFRPIVDRTVALYCKEFGMQTSLDKHAKTEILNALLGRFNLDGEQRTLFDIAARTASSLAAVFANERKDLILFEDI